MTIFQIIMLPYIAFLTSRISLHLEYKTDNINFFNKNLFINNELCVYNMYIYEQGCYIKKNHKLNGYIFPEYIRRFVQEEEYIVDRYISI